jgi:glycosyltransferase involved in cell wall biosynthesis
VARDRLEDALPQGPRRILFTSHYALPHLGGIEVAIDALARALCARGHEVTHVASAAIRPDDPPARPEPAPYRTIRVPALNGLERRLGVPYPLYSPALIAVLRREVARVDVVHAHGFLYMPTHPALWLARRHGAARVLTEHVGRVGYESPVLNGIELAAVASVGRAGARLAQAIVALNDKVEHELAALAPGRPIARIVNGVDTERYRPPSPEERRALRVSFGWDERPRALFVGRLVAKKGVGVAAAAAAGVGIELVVAGPGELPPAGGAHVTLLGPQPPDRVAELYRAADVFVLPSRGEGFPVTAQEALASGLPVVLADDPGYAPYVDGAGAGVRLVAPTVDAVAGAIGDLTADPAARESAGRRAALHARERFSWRRAADEHEALYERARRMLG